MGGGTVQGEAKAGAGHGLAEFPAGTHSPKDGVAGEIVWNDSAGSDREALSAFRPSLAISCR